MINLFVKFAYLAFFKRLRKPTGPKPSYVEWFNIILSDKKYQIPHHSEFIEFAGNHLLRLTFSEAIVGVQDAETYDFFKWLLFGIDQRTFIKEQKKCPGDLSSSSKKEEKEIEGGLIVDDGENYSLDDLLETIVHPNGEKINFWLLLIYLYFVI